jgi:hypothetical protein
VNRERRAFGFRAHSGWAMAVVVSGSPREPMVLERRRIATADAAIRGSKQPFHAAGPLPFAEAEALVMRCRESSMALAHAAVKALAAQYEVTTAAILSGSGRPLPELAGILKSHALIHTAEGELFRDVLVQAAGNCGLAVTRVREKEIWERGAATMKMPDLRERIDGLKKIVGPPWSADEKLAAVAGWIALASANSSYTVG